MSREGINWVPVVSNDGRLLGILTMESMRRVYESRVKSLGKSVSGS